MPVAAPPLKRFARHSHAVQHQADATATKPVRTMIRQEGYRPPKVSIEDAASQVSEDPNRHFERTVATPVRPDLQSDGCSVDRGHRRE
jgi:hypothetical protein